MDGVDTATWRKSSYSGNNGGDCVEVAGTASAVGAVSAVGAADAAGAVLVRDTVNRAARG